MVARPSKRRSQIVQLLIEPLKSQELTRALIDFVLCFCIFGEKLRVASARRLALARCRELLLAELPNRLEQTVAHGSGGPLDGHQGLTDQGVKQVENVGRGDFAAAAHALGGFQREPSGK